MIEDPYKVLGVSDSVSDADLKKAYREMSKRWHPDANPSDPEGAEAVFKEVQEAYRQIVDARAKGLSGYGPRQGAQSDYSHQYQKNAYGNPYAGGTSYDSQYADDHAFDGFEEFFNRWAEYSGARRAAEESEDMAAARNSINAGRYAEAMDALNRVDMSGRNGRWYFYAAHAASGMGRNIDAMDYAKRAVDMDPENPEYMSYLRYLRNGEAWYQQRGETYQGGSPMSSSTWCLSMCLLNLFWLF